MNRRYRSLFYRRRHNILPSGLKNFIMTILVFCDSVQKKKDIENAQINECSHIPIKLYKNKQRAIEWGGCSFPIPLLGIWLQVCDHKHTHSIFGELLRNAISQPCLKSKLDFLEIISDVCVLNSFLGNPNAYNVEEHWVGSRVHIYDPNRELPSS